MLVRTWLLVIAIGCLTGSGGLAQYPSFSEQWAAEQRDDVQDAQAHADQERAPEPPIIPQIAHPTDSTSNQHGRSGQDPENNETPDYLFWGDGLAQWLMAITGIVAVGFSIWAVLLIKSTLNETKTAAGAAVTGANAASAGIAIAQEASAATGKAADAAVSAAAAGWEAVKVSQELGMTQMRAHLSVDNVTVEPPVTHANGIKTCTVKIDLRNTGTTQTKGLRYDAGLSFGRPPVRRRPTVSSGSHDLGPQVTRKYAMGAIAWYVDEVINDPNFMIFLHIEMQFTDVFGRKITDEFYYMGAFNVAHGWPVRMGIAGDPFEVIRARD